MATFQAINCVCEAVIRQLRKHYDPDDFINDLDFQVFQAKTFEKNKLDAGVSLFLYRVTHNGTHRMPPGRILPNGRRAYPKLALDLHFFLTAWGGTASLQHTITGWMMRTMEDHPTLTSGFLNEVAPNVFPPDEGVDVSLVEMTTEDLLRVWETLVPQNYYELSVPYVARMVQIDSSLEQRDYPPVKQGDIGIRPSIS